MPENAAQSSLWFSSFCGDAGVNTENEELDGPTGSCDEHAERSMKCHRRIAFEQTELGLPDLCIAPSPCCTFVAPRVYHALSGIKYSSTTFFMLSIVIAP